MRLGIILSLLSLTLLGCGRSDTATPAGKIRFALNWVPEPEFGGIYAARQHGLFAANHLDVDILPGGAGAPTWQLVGAGQAEFGIASADEIVIARSRGADIVALFATYQDCPQAIMVHQQRGLQRLEDVFKGGKLAIEKGLPYTTFLEHKYDLSHVTLLPYDGGIATFLADPDYAQQCFIFSEPIAARRQGARVQTFLVADSGYNPYTGVVIARADYVRKNRPTVDAMLKCLREGWQSYLRDPAPANALMATLNKTMDQQTFAEAAEAQKPLVLGKLPPEQVGAMTLDRWTQLITQLRQLKVINEDLAPASCLAP